MPNGQQPYEYEYTEEGQQQPPIYPSSVMQPDFMFQRADVVEKQLDSMPTLIELRNKLLGYFENESGELVQIKESKLCNEIGANELLGMTAPLLQREIVLANMTDSESKKRAQEFEVHLAKQLVIFEQKWEVKNKDAIHIPLSNLVFANLTRPIGGRAHSGITKISTVTEQIWQKPQQEQQPRKIPFWPFNRRR